MQHKPSNYYIYGGGGNLVPFYADAAKVLASLSRQKAGLCVLPHSCFGVDSVLQLYEGDLTIFAREATTQHYLRSLDARHLTIKIDHDIGLSLDMEDPRLAMPRTFNALYGNAGRGQSLCILRNDCESVANPLLAGKNSIDISNLWPKGFPSRGFGVTYLDAPLVFNCVSWFLSLLAPAAVIHTDRLHVGIAAALLGKEVYLYDNCYKKISAVYEFSLKNRPGLNVKLG